MQRFSYPIVLAALFVAFILGNARGQDKPKGESPSPKPELCSPAALAGQPAGGCSEVGRTRLLLIYARATLLNQAAQQAQASLQAAVAEYNAAQIELVKEEGRAEGTTYQPDLVGNTLKATAPAPTPKKAEPSSKPPADPTKK